MATKRARDCEHRLVASLVSVCCEKKNIRRSHQLMFALEHLPLHPAPIDGDGGCAMHYVAYRLGPAAASIRCLLYGRVVCAALCFLHRKVELL